MSNTMQKRHPFSFSFAFLLMATVTISALFGWWTVRMDYIALKAQSEKRRSLLHQATVQAINSLRFDIAGEQLDDHPLIQVLGILHQSPSQAYIEQSIEERTWLSEEFPDKFNNQPSLWNTIDHKREIVCYELLLEELQAGLEGDGSHQIFVFVQDGVILLVTEHQSVISS